jgi:hypothetical protein
VKQANILKDLEFKRNEKKIIAICKYKKCKYVVFWKKLVDESIYLLMSLYPKHSCTRRYKNHMINSAWIAEWCMESFRNQPNLPIDVLMKEVKAKWNVDAQP